MKLKINVGDRVKVIAGADKGRSGVVLTLDSNKLKVRVQGVCVQTHFDKKKGQFEREGFIDYSNIQLLEKEKVEKQKAQ